MDLQMVYLVVVTGINKLRNHLLGTRSGLAPRASRSAAAAVGSSSNRLTAVRAKKLVRVFSGLQLQKAAQQLDSKARHVEWEKQTYIQLRRGA